MRIVAGEFRGRQLSTPAGDTTRPTAARAREALFAILADVNGERVLDLYAGSGALGLEALSRGAEQLVLVESSKAAQQAIRSNLQNLGVGARATLLPLRAEAAFKALERLGPFSLVFADPPWADAQAAMVILEKLASTSLLAPAARLVLEHAARTPPTPNAGAPLCAVDTRRWGDTAVTIFELMEAQGSVPDPSSS
ncbi:MAG TPA: 16S rRNA (guanine(966)-N(2))-methyltransferase RsmD [Polyangiaceae bacterium]|nr:16S rRNA (guanine(966)-N(2))-methyltransferase RsmD [Polyangiaceae bacterium]